MKMTDEKLLQTAHESLTICSAVSQELAKLFENDSEVSLSLQSKYGTLIQLPEQPNRSLFTLYTHPLLETLKTSETGEDRIALLLGSKEWNMISCFGIDGFEFYPVISVPAPPNELRWIRYELLAALDCFGLRCKDMLETFYNSAVDKNQSNREEKKGSLEKSVLQQLLQFSKQIIFAALIDDDGFVLLNEGRTENAEEIASTLALLNRQMSHALDKVGVITISSVTLSDSKCTNIIGKIPGQKISLALCVQGKDSHVVAQFLFNSGCSMLCSIQGSPLFLEQNNLQSQQAVRFRSSWFSAPQLVSQDNYVYSTDSTVFHEPSCTVIASAADNTLKWVNARGEAIKCGLAPCTICNP